MKKRIIAVFMAAFITVSGISVAAAETKQASPAEIAAIGAAVDLGLITFTDYSADKTIQRRDLAEAVVKSMGAEKQKYSAAFNDVEKNDDKANYINGAYSLGILSGYFDGGFHPFSTVTYSEAIKAMVTMVGYGNYAEYKGGYPGGYLTVANELKISRGMDFTADSPITLGKFCIMLLKTLEVDMLESVEVVGDDITFSSQNGKCLLIDNLELEVVEGKITANYMTELTGASKMDKNKIKIDGKIYFTTLDELPRELGKQFTFYVAGEDAKTVVAYKEKSGDNEEIFISSEDIISIKNGEIRYLNEDGGEETAELYDGADFIYNGRAKVSWSESDIPLVNSEIRIVDSNGDGNADVIFVNAYKNLIVKHYAEEDGVINFKTTEKDWQRISVSEKDDVVYEISDSEGNTVAPEEIAEWNILSVAKSLDGKVYVMKLSTQKTEGICTAKNDDEIVIDETTYNIDRTINSGSVNGNIEIGKSGTFYFDYAGRVAAVYYSEMPLKNYAYVLGFDNADKAFNDDVIVKVYDFDGSEKVYTLAEKIKINGVASKPTDILSDYKFISLGNAINQLVVYEKNSEGEIDSIYSAADASLYSEDEREMNFTISESLSSVMYRAGNMHMFASKYFATDNTIIFVVPDDVSETENFHIIKRTNLIGDREYNNVNIYDVDGNNKISAVVMRYSNLLFEAGVPSIAAVLKTSKGIDGDGSEITKITVRAGTAETVLNVEDGAYAMLESSAIVDLSKERADFVSKTESGISYIAPEKLNAGDIVQYVNAPSGKLSSLYLLHRVGTDTSKEVMGAGSASKINAYATKYYAFSKIEKVLDNAIRINVPAASGADVYERAFPFIKGTIFLKYNSEKQKIEEYAAHRLKAGDKVFIYAQATNVKLVVVYEGE